MCQGTLRALGQSGEHWRYARNQPKEQVMSPTIYRDGSYRFFFFSREESRMNVHIYSRGGEAKFWLEPEIELAKNHRLSRIQLKQIEGIIEEHYHEFTNAWRNYFSD
jgi:hypothetical protein